MKYIKYLSIGFIALMISVIGTQNIVMAKELSVIKAEKVCNWRAAGGVLIRSKNDPYICHVKILTNYPHGANVEKSAYMTFEPDRNSYNTPGYSPSGNRDLDYYKVKGSVCENYEDAACWKITGYGSYKLGSLQSTPLKYLTDVAHVKMKVAGKISCTSKAKVSGYTSVKGDTLWTNSRNATVTYSYDNCESTSYTALCDSGNKNRTKTEVLPSGGIQIGSKTPLKMYDAFLRDSSCPVGSIEGTSATKIKADTTAPTCRILGVDPTKPTNGSVKVKAQCTDNESGCETSQPYVTTSQNGTVRVQCKDKVGNTSYAYKNVTNIDKINPRCGDVSIPSGKYYNTSYKVSVKCLDDESGCTYGSFGDYTTGNITIPIADQAGNMAYCPVDSSLYDATPPSVNITLESGQEAYNQVGHQANKASIHAIVEASDNKAGVYKTCYQLSGATTKNETLLESYLNGI